MGGPGAWREHDPGATGPRQACSRRTGRAPVRLPVSRVHKSRQPGPGGDAGSRRVQAGDFTLHFRPARAEAEGERRSRLRLGGRGRRNAQPMIPRIDPTMRLVRPESFRVRAEYRGPGRGRLLAGGPPRAALGVPRPPRLARPSPRLRPHLQHRARTLPAAASKPAARYARHRGSPRRDGKRRDHRGCLLPDRPASLRPSNARAHGSRRHAVPARERGGTAALARAPCVARWHPGRTGVGRNHEERDRLQSPRHSVSTPG